LTKKAQNEFLPVFVSFLPTPTATTKRRRGDLYLRKTSDKTKGRESAYYFTLTYLPSGYLRKASTDAPPLLI
jgi:hypothetical protein